MRGSGEVRVIIRSSSLFVVVSCRGGCWRLVAEAGGDAIPRSAGAGGDEVDVAAGGQAGLDDLVDGVVDAADAGLVAELDGGGDGGGDCGLVAVVFDGEQADAAVLGEAPPLRQHGVE